MPQVKISLTTSQAEFVSRHDAWGFSDKSALVREALDEMVARLAKDRLAESARLYAEIYAEDAELRDLADSAVEGWPQ